MATIIAECCQNHGGDWTVLKDMVWAAADAGADYVKIQSMLPSELTYRERFESGATEDGRVTVIKRPFAPEMERMKSSCLTDEMHDRFIAECAAARVKPLTTAFSQSRIPFVSRLPWREIKVASYDCGSFPMIRQLAQHFDHLFISTGATYDDEIRGAAEILRERAFTFLHCVTIYPTPLEALDLARMEWLRQFTPSVGFSDHSLVARDGVKASVAALALGATAIERHFTVLGAGDTKDGPVSVNPDQLRELVALARLSQDDVVTAARDIVGDMAPLLGMADRSLSSDEKLNRDYYRGRFASPVGDGFVYNWEELDAGVDRG